MDDYVLAQLLIIISFMVTLGAQIYVNSSYKKYSKISNLKSMTGSEAARILLDRNGLNDVKINKIPGELSDNYNPKNKTVNLSSNIHNGRSIASIAVACHECGHAIQDKEGYSFMRLRASFVPIVNFTSKAGYFAIMFGFILGAINLIWIGILSEVVILVFQLITLPVEFDASKKALKEIENNNILDNSELSGAKVMLRSAALTYVASVCAAIMQILRLILLSRNRND